MAILNNSNAISSGGYDINNSLRFRVSASAYLNRTPASAGNRKTWTWSAWVKRGTLGTGVIFSGGTTSSDTGVNYIGFLSDQLIFAGISTYFRITSQVLRDPSAWYHIVVSLDTTQATANNRCLMYINGTVVTAFSTNNALTQNTDYGINQAAAHRIASESLSGGFGNFDGYIAEQNFIDGQALTPSSFGETDTTTGSWKPKAYSGTYGTNGFYLKFSDIATTSGSNAGLGKDFSGNANYWTTNNISVTAGTTYDAMIDSPTLTSATVANYCVLNPLPGPQAAAIGLITNANLSVANNNGANNMFGFGSIGITSDKYYWEVTVTGMPTANTSTMAIGICGQPYTDAAMRGYYNNGNYWTGSASISYGASYTTNDIIGIAFDATNQTIEFYKNGTSQSQKTSIGTSGINEFAWIFSSSTPGAASFNFGQRPFTYTPPSGFVALNTYNLPDSTIKKGNTVMDATTYSGSASNVTITNGGFQPDLVWMKCRSNADDNALVDSVRGVTPALFSNSTSAEISAGYLQSFNSNGATITTGFGTVNISGRTYVAWQWQAGQGTTSSNTSGSITSTVSVSTTAGFSVVTFTGNGTAGATVGHGLGVTPAFVIIKNRTATAGEQWLVWHKSISQAIHTSSLVTLNGYTGALLLNGTNSSFSYGFDAQINGSTNGMLAYCWAEIAGFSKFTSYTGNGSADGVFIYTGFRPKFVMIKLTSGAGSGWYMMDTSRDTYNVEQLILLANSSAAEATQATFDGLSNGIKIRTTSGDVNTNGATYILAAFAENPFKNANAR
jgi:hypothetical protein